MAKPKKTPKRITAEDYGKTDTEHAQQVALFIWAHENKERFPALRWLAAIPNGGERNKIVASRLKAEGVKSGFPDMILPVAMIGPRSFYCGLFVELKRIGETTFKEQDDWRCYLNSAGYKCVVCKGWEAARNEIVSYLTLPVTELLTVVRTDNN